jgi:hypothetical protein
MKNLQKFICLLALLVGINSLSAQTYSTKMVAKTPMGDDEIIIQYQSKDNFSLCDATYKIKYMFEDDYVPLTMKFCDKGENSYTIGVLDPEGNSHTLAYSNDYGLLMDTEGSDGSDGDVNYFGMQLMMKDYTSNKNTVYLFLAGENTRLSFIAPELDLDDEVFVFSSQNASSKFTAQFINITENGSSEEIVFTLEPFLNLNNEYAKCKLKRDKNNKFVMQIEYQNNKVAFLINAPE